MSHSPTKELLFLSYYFPPGPQVGGARVAKLSALALERGWHATVVATREGAAQDPPVPWPGPLALAWLDRSGNRGKSRFRRVCETVCSELFVLRDVAGFFRAARRAKRGRKVRVVLATMPPRRVVLAALLMGLLDRDLILVSDFRDPWVSSAHTGIRGSLSRFLLRQVLRRSDLVTAVTGAALQQTKLFSRADIGSKCLVVSNAVDVRIFDGIAPVRTASCGKIAFGHLGDLDYAHRNPVPLLQALCRIREEHPGLFGGMEFHFWGESGFWQGNDLPGHVAAHGLGGMAHCHETVDRSTALGLVAGLDVLVLFAFNQPLQIPAKAYEYLSSGKPILAFCEEPSETYRLLINHPAVELVTSLDPEAIISSLARMADTLHRGGYQRCERDLAGIDYRSAFTPLFERIEALAGCA